MKNKPFQLRVIFLMHVILSILPFIMYYVFTLKNISIEGINPIHIVYTGIAYILNFILIVISIINKKLIYLRVLLVTTLLISIPVKAYIGFVIAIISIFLSFNEKVKQYLKS